MNTPKYLKNLDKITLKKLLEIAKGDLSEDEYWILYYCYVEKRMAENTAAKLHISRSKYFISKSIALIKMEYVIKKLDKIQTL